MSVCSFPHLLICDRVRRFSVFVNGGDLDETFLKWKLIIHDYRILHASDLHGNNLQKNVKTRSNYYVYWFCLLDRRIISGATCWKRNLKRPSVPLYWIKSRPTVTSDYLVYARSSTAVHWQNDSWSGQQPLSALPVTCNKRRPMQFLSLKTQFWNL